MVEIIVCVGSSCHCKGSGAVIEQYQDLIRQHQLQKEVTLKASFCHQACTRGIAVSFNGRTIYHLTPESAAAAFTSEVLDQTAQSRPARPAKPTRQTRQDR
ncbi:MAG: (2Fe-2S) ferredoxin domain-containing protein [Eubacteriales bacterium]|nr:(2Fe-2S) ferredoxin domain-containing protein [Eubacteriales bacterium]